MARVPSGDPGTVSDEAAGREPGPQTPEDLGTDFLKGYEPTPCAAADSPNYPGNQTWEGPGALARQYKAHWKNKPRLFPYGSNDEGGK